MCGKIDEPERVEVGPEPGDAVDPTPELEPRVVVLAGPRPPAPHRVQVVVVAADEADGVLWDGGLGTGEQN